MTKNCLPYYKRYPRDFVEGTVGMPFELKGAYSILLDILYLQGGKCPDDPRYISGLLGCSVRKWNALRKDLLALKKVAVEDGFLTNYRVIIELAQLDNLRIKQSKNVSKRYKSKGYENSGNTNQNQNQNIHSDATHLRVAAPPKKATRLPDDWKPSEVDLAFAEKEGRTTHEALREAERFRDYWTSKAGKDAAKVDWAATWRNWIRRSVDSRQPSLALVNGGAYKPKPRGRAAIWLEMAADYERMENDTENINGKLTS